MEGGVCAAGWELFELPQPRMSARAFRVLVFGLVDSLAILRLGDAKNLPAFGGCSSTTAEGRERGGDLYVSLLKIDDGIFFKDLTAEARENEDGARLEWDGWLGRRR